MSRYKLSFSAMATRRPRRSRFASLGFSGPPHELADLEMDAHDVRPKLLHLPEVGLDLRPFLLPIVFQEAAVFIVIVVEAPGAQKPLPIFQPESPPVIGDPNPMHFPGRYPVCSYTEEDDQEQRDSI